MEIPVSKIREKYSIEDHIGSGKFGTVFLGEHIISKKKVAIKLEQISIRLLKNETILLEYLSRNGCYSFIPKIHWYGIEDAYRVLVMTYYEQGSLRSYIHQNGMNMNSQYISYVNRWIQSAIRILEKIHQAGVIHRDIKPDHFMRIETYSCTKWHLIDFGFATFFIDEHRKKIPRKKEQQETIIGTPNYISLHIHNGEEPSCRDDLISLGYIYLELYRREKVPWANIECNKNTEYSMDHIYHEQNQKKKKWKEMDILFSWILEKGIYKGILDFLRECYEYSIDETPNYHQLYTIFTE